MINSMKKISLVLILILSTLTLSACSGGKELLLQSVNRTAPKETYVDVGDSFAPVNVIENDLYGSILTTRNNKVLYTFSKDNNGVSNCYEDCEIAWPPFLVDFEEDVGGYYSTTQRNDGSLQVTYKNKPLYTYIYHLLTVFLLDWLPRRTCALSSCTLELSLTQTHSSYASRVIDTYTVDRRRQSNETCIKIVK